MTSNIIINILKNIFEIKYMTKKKTKIKTTKEIIIIIEYNNNNYYYLSTNKIDELSSPISISKLSDLELIEFLLNNSVTYSLNDKYKEILDFCLTIYNNMLIALDLNNEKLVEDNLQTNFYNLLNDKENNENFQFLSVFYNKFNELNKANIALDEEQELLIFSNFKRLCEEVYKKVDDGESYFSNLSKETNNEIFLLQFLKGLKKTFVEFLIKYTIIKKNSAAQTNYVLINEFGLSVFRLYIGLFLISVTKPKEEKIETIQLYEKYFIQQQAKPENIITILGQYFLTFFETLYANIIQEKVEIKTNLSYDANKKQNTSSYYYKIKGLDENSLLEYIDKTQIRLPLRYTPPKDWTCEKTAKIYNLKDNYTGCYSNNEKIKMHPIINLKIHTHEILLTNEKTLDALNLAQKKPFILDWAQIDYYKSNKHKTLITKEKMEYLKIKKKKKLIDVQNMSKYYEQYFLLQDLEKYKNDYLYATTNTNFILNQKLYETYNFSVNYNILPNIFLTYVPLSLEWRLRWTQTSAIGYLTSDIFRSFMNSPKPYIVTKDEFYVILANKLFSIQNFNVDLCKKRVLNEIFFCSGYKKGTEINAYLLSINCSEIVNMFKILTSFFNLKNPKNKNPIIENQTNLLLGLDNTSSGQQLANIALLNGFYAKQLNLENTDEVVNDLYLDMGQKFYNEIKKKANNISNDLLQKMKAFDSLKKHDRFRIKYTNDPQKYFTYIHEELVFNNEKKKNELNAKRTYVNIVNNIDIPDENSNIIIDANADAEDSNIIIDASDAEDANIVIDTSDAEDANIIIDASNEVSPKTKKKKKKKKKRYFIHIYFYPEKVKIYHLLEFLNAIDIKSKLYRTLIKAILMPASYNAKEQSLRYPIKSILSEAENKKQLNVNHYAGVRTVFINAFLHFISSNNLLTLNKLINFFVRSFLKIQKGNMPDEQKKPEFYWYHLSGAFITPGYMKRQGNITQNRFYYTIPSPFFKRAVTKNIKRSVILKKLTPDFDKLTTSTSPNIIHGLDSALIHHILLNIDPNKSLFCVHDCFLMPLNEFTSFRKIYPQMLYDVFYGLDKRYPITEPLFKNRPLKLPLINTLVSFLVKKKCITKETEIQFNKMFKKMKKTQFCELNLSKLKKALFLSIK